MNSKSDQSKQKMVDAPSHASRRAWPADVMVSAAVLPGAGRFSRTWPASARRSWAQNASSGRHSPLGVGQGAQEALLLRLHPAGRRQLRLFRQPEDDHPRVDQPIDLRGRIADAGKQLTRVFG